MPEEAITVGAVSDGPDAGEVVTLPVVDMLTGRGFVTGKSGSGKSNSASVIAEKLLDRGYALLVVDIDGEYYGLKEKYEILHVGADDECDIQVGPEHAEKLATLALENNVPIILDVSSYLDEDKATDLLTAVAQQLFAKEKKLKKPFLLLVEEVHEYIPEGGGIDECGQMLIKIGKRGRKHGLGITGISQRPADVKKDFITQCDWLCWHRLTWKNDTQVVRRVLSGEYAEAVESLDDGEAFVRADWLEEIRRVQFDRKRTFDAGATPGLEDFERPDLKPVSTDLVSELEQITENERHREAEIERLERELAQKEERIETLERELADARDLSRMADQFAAALFDHSGRSRAQLESEHEQQSLDVYPMRLHDVHSEEHLAYSENGALSDGPTDETTTPSSDPATDAQSEPSVNENGEGEQRESGVWTDPTDENESENENRDEAEDGGEFDRSVLQHIQRDIESLDPVAREMLVCYRREGPLSPVDAHDAAGGSGDRMDSYCRNSALRHADLIAHVGRGQYAYAIPDRIASDDPSEKIEACVERIEDDLLSETE